MASIVENIVGDRALQLGNEEFVRKMTVGNNWNFLRVGVRLRANGVADIATPRFQIGLNNGDQNTFSSSNCAGYIGAYLGDRPGPVWSTSGSYPFYYFIGSGGGVSSYTTKKLVNTVTDLARNATGGVIGGIDTPPSLFLVDFLRASASSYTVTTTYAIAANLISTSFYTLMRVMEDEKLTSTFSLLYITGQTTGSTLTGMPSNMDTVSLYWNKATPTVEVSDLCVIRFY